MALAVVVAAVAGVDCEEIEASVACRRDEHGRRTRVVGERADLAGEEEDSAEGGEGNGGELEHHVVWWVREPVESRGAAVDEERGRRTLSFIPSSSQ